MNGLILIGALARTALKELQKTCKLAGLSRSHQESWNGRDRCLEYEVEARRWMR